MSEGGHDGRSARAENAVLTGHEIDIPHFLAQAGMGQGVEPVQRLPILRARHPFKQMNGRKAARNDSKARLPAHLADESDGSNERSSYTASSPATLPSFASFAKRVGPARS